MSEKPERITVIVDWPDDRPSDVFAATGEDLRADLAWDTPVVQKQPGDPDYDYSDPIVQYRRGTQTMTLTVHRFETIERSQQAKQQHR